MCDNEHLSALANYMVNHCERYAIGTPERVTDPPSRAELFAALYAENVESLRSRYSDDWDSMVGDAEYKPLALCADPVRIIKAAQCYQYQACEHDGWQTSWARKATDAVISNAIDSLPGYKQAPWGSPLEPVRDAAADLLDRS